MTDLKHPRSGLPGATARAAAAAEARVRAARSDALFATCRWICAEGGGDEAEARERMRLADDALNAARNLRDRVSCGTATSHEIIQLLRSGANTTRR